ncbi:MAG: DUF4157 domain-containing protein [Nitrospina sp.]|nr:DUF4157 domain-containing protein [Nitrospina sp.]
MKASPQASEKKPVLKRPGRTHVRGVAASLFESFPAFNILKPGPGSEAAADRSSNQLALRAQHPSAVQAKLKVGSANDSFEQEADRMAEAVTSGAAPGRATPAAISIQRKRSSAIGDAPAAPAGVERVAAAPGQPLSTEARAYFEPRFGRDFSGVRVHTDSGAAEATNAINAEAFTTGNNIAFAQGNYAPETEPGRKLLAHELTHVVQQEAGGGASVQRKPVASAETPTEEEEKERAITPDAPQDFKSLKKARESVRDELVIEAMANGFLGGKGRNYEYGSILFREVTPEGDLRYSHTRAFPDEEHHVQFSEGDLHERVKETRERQGKTGGPDAEVFELAHSHPTGVRASMELRPESLSGPDIEVGRAGAEGGTPSSLALVSPSGGYDVVGVTTGGRVQEDVLPRTEANRFGFRPDYLPDVPDLPGVIRGRIDYIVAEQRAALTQQLPDATKFQKRAIERKLKGLERRHERAIRKLERQVRKGKL